MNKTVDMVKEYTKIFGSTENIFTSEAPGRANIIGEHTDYNEGFVMPIAISLFTKVAGAPNGTNEIRIYSKNLDSFKKFSLNKITASEKDNWDGYIRGIIWALRKRNIEIEGFNAVIHSEIPL